MVWTLINDPVKRLFKYIYSQIQGCSSASRTMCSEALQTYFREVPEPPPGPQS